MSDEEKNKKSQGENKSDKRHIINKSEGRSERSEPSRTTREEWSKIDKKGQGSGDRPKK